jgi:thiamine pyrophosphokinase
MNKVDAVILANGLFPTADEPLRLLHEARYVVCCDGAARHWPQCDAIVGDGDSVPDELRQRLIQVSEQEDNDLTKATRHCMALGLRRLAYLGATGRREDHTLGNISLLMRYFRDFGLDVLMATDDGWFVPASGTATFDSKPGQQVSLFNFGCTRLVSE